MKKVVWLMNERSGFDISSSLVWWYGILENMGYEVVYSIYEDYDPDEFYYSIKEYKPDFVLHPTYTKIHTEFLKLREFTKVYIVQSDDRWRYADFSRFWIPIVDGIITYSGEVENYLSNGMKEENLCKLRWSFNPNMMQKIEKPTLSYYNISHTGSIYGNRRNLLNQFGQVGKPVDIFENITYDTTKDIWNCSGYSLCLTLNSTMQVREPKGRIAEIPYFSVLLTEPFPEMENYYDMDKECVLFNSVEEAIEKIKKIDQDKLYEGIYTSGKKRLLSTNTCYHEWQKILPKIDPDYKEIDVTKLLLEEHGIEI